LCAAKITCEFYIAPILIAPGLMHQTLRGDIEMHIYQSIRNAGICHTVIVKQILSLIIEYSLMPFVW